ncbi:BA75_03421T1 [Komagataella pastoris]|uniref:BA75_03421T1 n=1 Tax=Komagataella pastoris TaxID=4922 RepID=A0A1B2JFZ6_PICPA|nr:BA75_03421T1 [Komagataella pastoris]
MPDETSGSRKFVSTVTTAHNACESARDLSRLGYDFSDILRQSSINEEFLRKTFKMANLPLTKSRASKKRILRQDLSDTSKKFRSAPFGNDNWIKDLVIELSDDDFDPMWEEHVDWVAQKHTRKEEESRLKQELVEKERKMEELRKHIESLENRKSPSSQSEETPTNKLTQNMFVQPEKEFQVSKIALLQDRILKTSKLLDKYQIETENDQIQIEKLEQELNLRIRNLNTKLKLLSHVAEIMARQQRDLKDLFKEQSYRVDFGVSDKWINDETKAQPNPPADHEPNSQQLFSTEHHQLQELPPERREIDDSAPAHEHSDEIVGCQLVSMGTREEEHINCPVKSTGSTVNTSIGKFEPYRSPLICFKSYRFSPCFDDRKISSLTWNSKLDPLKEFCLYEVLNGICSDPGCLLQHFSQTFINETDIIIDLAKAVVGESGEEKHDYIKSLTKLLSLNKNEPFESMVNIIKGFRQTRLPSNTFLDWIRFETL